MPEKPTPLLFFEAITLCHVRELSPSDGREAMGDSQHRAWWLFPRPLGEAIKIDF